VLEKLVCQRVYRFSNNPQISNFTKVHPEGAKWFYADRYDEANSYFSEYIKKLSP
jgi:hypothetical protein